MIGALLLVGAASAQDVRDAMAGAYARLWGSAPWEYLHGPAVTGDWDGDGVLDTAVGNFQGAAYYYAAGEVQILPGSLVTGDVDLALAPVDLHGGSEHDYVGVAVLVYPQDDGPDGIIVGADHSGLTEDDQGQVLLWNAPLALSGWQSAEGADVVVRGDDAQDLFGRVVVRTPDLDGDGQDDWAIGAPGRDNAYTDKTGHSVNNREAGRAWVVLGNFRGLDGAVNAGEAASATITGAGETLFTGWRLCSGGDHDGDGLADLVVGMLDQDGGFQGELGVFSHIHEGLAATTDSADGVWVADHPDAYAGTGLACGDPDGDGIADVWAGAPYLDGGKGRVWHVSGLPKGREPLDGAAIEKLGGEDGSAFGMSVALGAKLLVGAPSADQVWVGEPDLSVDYLLAGPVGFGSWVGWAGDANQDGVADAAIAAPGATWGHENQGVVALVSGVDVLNATVPLVEAGTGLDLDGDGIAAPDDCDDVDPARSPLEDEVCNDGMDNDCDRFVDEADCVRRGCATGPGAGWLAAALAALAIGRRRAWVLTPLLVACTSTPDLTLGLPGGKLAGVVDVTAQGNFEQLALLVDGITLAGGPGPALTSTWDTRTVEDGDHLVTAVGYKGDLDPVEVTETVEVDQSVNDVSPPLVQFESPADGDLLAPDLIPIVLEVSDDIGVASVEILANDSLLATIPGTGPYELAWENVVDGAYTLTAVATDLAGNPGSASIDVTVSGLAEVTCTMTHPDDGDAVWGDVQMTVAAGSSAGITQVEFFLDGTSIGVDTAADPGWGWLVDVTPYLGLTIHLEAVCSAQDGASASSGIDVTVDKTANAFFVNITQPSDGGSVSGVAVPVKAAIGNGEGADHAELYVDDLLVGTDDASDWLFTWDSTTVTNGTHTLKVVGYEANTGATAEDSISVSVNN